MDSSYRFAVRSLSVAVILLTALDGVLLWHEKDTGNLSVILPAVCTGLLGLLVPNRSK